MDQCRDPTRDERNAAEGSATSRTSSDHTRRAFGRELDLQLDAATMSTAHPPDQVDGRVGLGGCRTSRVNGPNRSADALELGATSSSGLVDVDAEGEQVLAAHRPHGARGAAPRRDARAWVVLHGHDRAGPGRWPP